LREIAERLDLRYDTVKRWVSRGLRELEAGEDSLYARLAFGVAAGREEAASMELSEDDLVRIVEHDARKSWRAAVWLLERQWPERWATGPRRAEIEGKGEHGDNADPFDSLDELASRRESRTA
jgi:transposase